jgi:hypothetical protein
VFSEQPRQLRFGFISFARVGCGVGPRARLEKIAEIRLRFVPDLFRGGLAAMLRDARIVVDAQLADVQFGPALGALIEPPQRQAQMCQGRTAIPADEIVAHGLQLTPFGVSRPLVPVW